MQFYLYIPITYKRRPKGLLQAMPTFHPHHSSPPSMPKALKPQSSQLAATSHISSSLVAQDLYPSCPLLLKHGHPLSTYFCPNIFSSVKPSMKTFSWVLSKDKVLTSHLTLDSTPEPTANFFLASSSNTKFQASGTLPVASEHKESPLPFCLQPQPSF